VHCPCQNIGKLRLGKSSCCGKFWVQSRRVKFMKNKHALKMPGNVTLCPEDLFVNLPMEYANSFAENKSLRGLTTVKDDDAL
jgi:hypothetical protein